MTDSAEVKPEVIRAVIERFARDFVNNNDLAAYQALVAKDYVDHGSPQGGYQSMLDSFNAMRAGMPDLQVELEQLISQGDCVAGRKVLRGTHTGNLFGIPATGEKVEIHVIDVVRVQGGQFIENWAYNDAAQVIAGLTKPAPHIPTPANTPVREIAEIDSYHAHVYFDMSLSRPDAVMLTEQISAQFPTIHLSQLYDKPIGPHTWPMFEAAFDVATFPSFVPWLMLNRRGLNILIHPNTDDMYADHVINPIWLGDKLPLKSKGMPRSGTLGKMPGIDQRPNF